MEKLVMNAWVKAQIAKQKVKDLFFSEDGGADSIIIAVIIIVVVVALAIIFKDTIAGWFNGLIEEGDELMSTDFTNVSQ